MDRIFSSSLAGALLFLLSVFAGCSNGDASVCIEAESFDNCGGWVLNQQYMDQMGSPYLMAHGLGTPVEDALTTVNIPQDGRWHIFAKTYNWTSPWTDKSGPGKFHICIDGRTLPETLGESGDRWEWQYAGSARLSAGTVTLALRDLTGFDGRCDAVLISRTRHPDFDNLPVQPRDTVLNAEYDFVVVGGGVAGMCAAVSASRLGLRTALVHDRAVLGGNNSSEIRVHASGMLSEPPYPNLGLMMREFGHAKVINGDNDGSRYGDSLKRAFVDAEPNLSVFYENHVIAAEKDGDRIVSVTARNTRTGAVSIFRAPLFADCTGDGNLGYMVGADYLVGRESKVQTGERSASKVSDCQVLGASVLWNSVKTDSSVVFPEFEYGIVFCDSSAYPITHGEWTWETGMRRDQIAEAERIRDYGMLVAYSNWSYIKNHHPLKEEFSCRTLNWVSYIAGKRESRRLLGDYILNQNDIENYVIYPDASVTLSWSIDLHYPDPANSRWFPGEEFVSVCNQDPIRHYPIPYRCFYSRNVSNLFMAGRDISVTHVALGSVRVMRTTSMMGEVVGMAASVCHDKGCLPRAVYESYLDELKSLMKEGTGRKGLPDNQNYHHGQTNLHKYVSDDI